MSHQKAMSWLLYGLVFLAGLGLAVCLSLWWPGGETGVRSGGGVLQLLGLGGVALGIKKLRRAFKQPKMWVEFAGDLRSAQFAAWRWWRRVRGYAPNVITMSGTGRGPTARAVGTLSSAEPLDMSMEARVVRLETAQQALNNRVRELAEQTSRETHSLKETLKAEAVALREANSELKGKVEHLAVGGIRLETVGLLWLIFGTVLVTWAAELAR